jgi:uncharacterized membrane protein (DUF4010 family)
MDLLPIALDLFIAALAGMVVGIEREWSGHATGPDARFAGIRTFTLLGGLGGLAGWFARSGQVAAGVTLLAAGCAFAIGAYLVATLRPGATPDGTTEVAALVTLALGFTAGLGYRAIAGGSAALMVLLLAEKTALQRFLARIDERELRAALQFAVLALVVLPLLPSDGYGPYQAFRPRELWTVVLLFSGLSFAGYLARRAIGETRGLAITGLLGGLVSSTAVSLHFSRRSRTEPGHAAPLAVGVVGACTVLLPRILLVGTILRPALLPLLLPRLAPAFVIGVVLVATALVRDHRLDAEPDGTREPPTEVRNPLDLWTSIQMAVAFQVVLFLVAWLSDRVGAVGVLGSAALLGLTDMDALTLSMTRLAADDALRTVAADAIAIGVLANTALKTGLVTTLGASGYRGRAAAGLLLLGAGGLLGLWLGTRVG